MSPPLTRASARADSASLLCRRILSVRWGVAGGRRAPRAAPRAPPYREGEDSREVPVLRGIPERFLAAPERPT